MNYLQDNHKHIRDIACGENHTIAVSTQGELYAWGGLILIFLSNNN